MYTTDNDSIIITQLINVRVCQGIGHQRAGLMVHTTGHKLLLAFPRLLTRMG